MRAAISRIQQFELLFEFELLVGDGDFGLRLRGLALLIGLRLGLLELHLGLVGWPCRLAFLAWLGSAGGGIGWLAGLLLLGRFARIEEIAIDVLAPAQPHQFLGAVVKVLPRHHADLHGLRLRADEQLQLGQFLVLLASSQTRR